MPLLLALGGCGERGGGGGGDGGDGTAVDDDLIGRAGIRGLSDAYPYRRDSPHAPVLGRCALIERSADACTLATLPFVEQESDRPTVDDVMDRVLVTHDWMGERFERLLVSYSEELLPLFGAVTSIVIGSTVRPSFYWNATGGMQLDPEGLWLDIPEKRSVAVEDDYRAPYRRLLAFRNLWTLRKGDRSAVPYFDLKDFSERDFDDIVVDVMDLLFHELAHARDFLPPGTAALLDRAKRPADALEEISNAWLSPSLAARLPLNSSLLAELARVRFRGETPTEAQSRIDADTAGAEMAFDGATHFYSYHTIREDFADLFETLMMKRLFDVDLAIAFVDQPSDPDDYGCADLTVGWGVRNRLGDPSVSERARDAVESIYGYDPGLDAFLREQVGTEFAMTPGVDWCANLAGGVTPTARSRAAEERTLRESAGHAERHLRTDEWRSTRETP